MRLDPKDAAELIKQTRSENSVLIGGQAVAFWIRHFGITARLKALTADIDYLGTRREAQIANARLSAPHALALAAPEDLPNAAVLSVTLAGYREPVLIDYLAGIIGPESREIVRTAVSVDFEGQPLKIIHPFALLQSKIWNLYRLAGKRTPEGIEQARLAIEIQAAFLRKAQLARRELLKAIEKIARFAATDPARNARRRFGLECLKAVPDEALQDGVLPAAFRKKRWPQLVAAAK